MPPDSLLPTPLPAEQTHPCPGAWLVPQEGVESVELSVARLDPQPRTPLQGGTHSE